MTTKRTFQAVGKAVLKAVESDLFKPGIYTSRDIREKLTNARVVAPDELAANTALRQLSKSKLWTLSGGHGPGARWTKIAEQKLPVPPQVEGAPTGGFTRRFDRIEKMLGLLCDQLGIKVA